KRTGAAALKMAVDMTRKSDLGISREEALQRITAEHLDQVLHPQFGEQDYKVLAKGLPASPGAAVGKAYFTADDAADAADRGEQPKEFDTVLGWADKIRKGKLAVRANADTGADSKQAREFGAEGIGLCRTEHMFLGEDRLPVVRRMILADTPEEEEAALEELR